LNYRSVWYVVIKSLIFIGVYTAFHYAHPVLHWPVFAVSEAVWEHIKIGYFAAALMALVECILLLLTRTYVYSWWRFFFSRISAVLLVPVLLFLLFYLPISLFGKITPNWLEIVFVITITVLSALMAFHTENEILDFPWEFKPSLLLLQIMILIIATLLFIAFTYNAPYYPLFTER
jgi:hypothetical protein